MMIVVKRKPQAQKTVKKVLKSNDYKNFLCKNEIILKSQRKFKSEAPALISNDAKRVKTFGRITIYAYGTNPFKVCENGMLSKYK